MAKVASLHGTTPAEIFESGIENLDRIEAVARTNPRSVILRELAPVAASSR